MKPKTLILLGLVVSLVFAAVHVTVNVSEDSKVVFKHYENVTVDGNVSVFIPVVTLSAGMDEGTLDEFSHTILSEVNGTLESRGLKAEFRGEALNLYIPGVQLPEPEGPVVVIFIPSYGRKSMVLYEECHATVLLYMNSNPDLDSYYFSMAGDYSSSDHDLERLAEELFKRAQMGEVGPYSLEVVYWKELKVRTAGTSEEKCWSALAEKIGKEIEGWAKTLHPKGS